uniref:VRR-NUC domain-containing protein n=1 Tax=viral metagenome TaxID=1070528 RepID=A0A6M3L386_9ZZZZ
MKKYLSGNISEADWQNTVIDLARLGKWRCAHFRSVRVQRKDGSVYYQTPVQADGAGYPDLCMVKGNRLIYAELKREGGKATSEQIEWLEALSKVPGVECYIWEPSDYEDVKWILLGGIK